MLKIYQIIELFVIMYKNKKYLRFFILVSYLNIYIKIENQLFFSHILLYINLKNNIIWIINWNSKLNIVQKYVLWIKFYYLNAIFLIEPYLLINKKQ